MIVKATIRDIFISNVIPDVVISPVQKRLYSIDRRPARITKMNRLGFIYTHDT